MERRLAAVLIADVVGYGRLSQVDEEGTRTRFQDDLIEIFKPTIARHHGRLVKTMGDGLLVEFASVVDAVRCAIELQRSKGEANRTTSRDRQLVYRIGINLGDVIVEGDDIHGDGVNLAERLQGLADPGGVTISASVYDQVKSKPEFELTFLREQRVKNVAEAVRVYAVLTGVAATMSRISRPKTDLRLWRRTTILASAFIIIAVTIAVAFWLKWPPQRPWPADKQSIIVLPFTNMSGDPAQEYFADGITEDLTTDLSQVGGLFVISRNTAFTYKGKTVKPSQLADDLQVKYVLEGSVRRDGDVLRINAQLIDAASEVHTWADRYDGSFLEVFSLQDKVTRSIVEALKLRLSAEEKLAIERRETTSLAAYDAFLRGWEFVIRGTGSDSAKAVPYLKLATDSDPDYGRAYAALALVYVKGYNAGWARYLGTTESHSRALAYEYLLEAKKHPTALSHRIAALVLWIDNHPDEALIELQEAIKLSPGDAWSYAYMAGVLTSAGRPAEAVTYIRRAMQMDPIYPSEFMHILAMSQFAQDQFDDAAASLETATRLNPGDESHFLALASTYGHLGRKQEALAATAKYNAIRIQAGSTPISVLDSPRMRFRRPPDVERFRQGLRLAGLPATLGGWLSGKEISKLLFGHRLRGSISDSGREYTASFTTEGAMAMSGDWGSVSGVVVHVDGYQLCIENPENETKCANLLRNESGNKVDGNEYIWLDGGGGYPFSVVD